MSGGMVSRFHFFFVFSRGFGIRRRNESDTFSYIKRDTRFPDVVLTWCQTRPRCRERLYVPTYHRSQCGSFIRKGLLRRPVVPPELRLQIVFLTIGEGCRSICKKNSPKNSRQKNRVCKPAQNNQPREPTRTAGRHAWRPWSTLARKRRRAINGSSELAFRNALRLSYERLSAHKSGPHRRSRKGLATRAPYTQEGVQP